MVKKKGKDRVVNRLDASDIAKIEDMKRFGVYNDKPVVFGKPSLASGCVWLANMLDAPGVDDFNELNRSLFWYGLLYDFCGEEFE